MHRHDIRECRSNAPNGPSTCHRLGMSVVVRLDGDRGVLDRPAMAAAWGLGDGQLSQDSLRRPPDDGVVDTALDARVQRHLRKWMPTAPTISH